MTRADEACALPVQAVKIDLIELARPQDKRSDRMRLAASGVACLLLHAALLYWIEPKPQLQAPFEEAIPVEVVIEPPAPEPAPEEKAEEQKQEQAEAPPPAPEQPAQTLDQQPATDFARAAEQEKEDGKDADAGAREEPETANKPEQQAEQAQEQKPVEAEPPPPLSPEAEPVAPAPAKTPHYAAMTPLPDLVFQAPAKRSDLPSGTAQPGYLSTLYGRIMRQMRAPQRPAAGRKLQGRIVFGIRSDGRIFQEAIAIRSGFADLDAAALAAVRRAAPYPPPPGGGPVYIRFDYGSN